MAWIVLFVGALFSSSVLTRFLLRTEIGWTMAPAMLVGSCVLLALILFTSRRRPGSPRRKGPWIRGQVSWGFIPRGIALGLALFVVGGLAYALVAAFGVPTDPPSSAAGPVAYLAVAFAAAAVLEEVAFRGVLLGRLATFVGRPWAVLIQSAIFSAYHLSSGQLLSTWVYGLVLGWVTLREGRLGTAIIAHLVLNGLGLAFFLASPADSL